jgi:mono/diheme cytochrome c family protein
MTDPTARERELFGGAESDVEQIHRQIVRELADPAEGYEHVPRFMWVAVGALIFWAGWYIGRRGGSFDNEPHTEYAQMAPAAGDTSARAASANVDPIEAGKQIFSTNCVACHQSTGLGVPGAFPPLVGSEWVVGKEQTLARILLNGLSGAVHVKGGVYNGAMPAWKDALSDDDIAHVLTYIRQWSPNAAKAVTAETVAGVRKETAARPTPWTESELKAGDDAAPTAGGGGGGKDSASGTAGAKDSTAAKPGAAAAAAKTTP